MYACRLDHKEVVMRYMQENGSKTSPHASARSFMGYPLLSENAVLVATPRDPCRYEHIGAVRNTVDEKASIMTAKGAMWLSPEEYMELAGMMSADIVVAMGDEVVSDCKKGRVVSSSKRTIDWMARCLHVRNSTIGDRPLLLCPIVGGSEVATREDAYRYIHNLVEQSDGVYISGLGTGESPASRFDILDCIVNKAPRDGLRMVSGISNPGEVLQAIARGIDVFDTSFIDMATRSGCALHFPIDARGDTAIGIQESSSAGIDATKMNLWSEVYVRDKSPLVPHCPCDTCQNHTRAYIHHLLITHEMTATVLLEQHNIYHMVSFFRAIRSSIEQGGFQDYLERWKERQHQWQQT